MSTTQLSIVHKTQHRTIVVPELERLTWRDKLALKVSIWPIERTCVRSQGHEEMLIERHAASMVTQRELASVKWLPPR